MTGIEGDILLTDLLTDEEIIAAEARAGLRYALVRWAEPDPAARARRQAEAEAAHAAVRAERAAAYAKQLADEAARRDAALALRAPGFYWMREKGYPALQVSEWTEDGQWKLPGDDVWLDEHHIEAVYGVRIEPPE